MLSTDLFYPRNWWQKGSRIDHPGGKNQHLYGHIPPHSGSALILMFPCLARAAHPEECRCPPLSGFHPTYCQSNSLTRVFFCTSMIVAWSMHKAPRAVHVVTSTKCTTMNIIVWLGALPWPLLLVLPLLPSITQPLSCHFFVEGRVDIVSQRHPKARWRVDTDKPYRINTTLGLQNMCSISYTTLGYWLLDP